MDNAQYQSYLDPDSKVPNTQSNKSENSACLGKSNVQYDKKMKKAELLDLLGIILAARKDIIKLFEEAKSRIDADRWAKFETRVEIEEKLKKLHGIKDEDVDPVVFDMTDEDSEDSQRTIPYQFSCQRRRRMMTLKMTMTFRTVSPMPSMMLMRFCAISVVALNHQNPSKRKNIYPGFRVILVISFAMKLLPRRYKEDQTYWFAKRGYNWHITVTYINDEVEQLNKHPLSAPPP
ncbi:unnamed protein product [Mytilus coruscus]|uniref:Uncharacterized protein n=1 Tax=Mytilus coruscus TaxID=42192 RepID=A0A6J8A9A6_MYTCO|nr:unnamed protein product [Mytilus coruscus]